MTGLMGRRAEGKGGDGTLYTLQSPAIPLLDIVSSDGTDMLGPFMAGGGGLAAGGGEC